MSHCGVSFNDIRKITPRWFSESFPNQTIGIYTLSIERVTYGHKIVVSVPDRSFEDVIVHHLWDVGEVAMFCKLTDISF